MLKITPAVGHRFNVAYNGEPVRLKDLKLGDETIRQIDDMLHSLKDKDCNAKVAFLTYEKVGEEPRVKFFRNFFLGYAPMYISGFPLVDLLSYLAQIELAILHYVVMEADTK